MDPQLVIAGVVIVVLLVVIAMMAGKKKSPPGPFPMSSKKSSGATPVKAKVVWMDSAEGKFDQAFDYAARKAIKNSKLRYHMQTLVEAYCQRKCGGVIVKHPSGRETQVIKFKGQQKVDKKPFLAIDFVSFTSDKRRTLLFLDGAKVEEIACEDEALFELSRKNILAQTEGGRKTCPLSNLAYRQTFVAPIATEN